MSTHEEYVVGQRYMIPVIPVGSPLPMGDRNTITLGDWMGFTGDLPILTPWSKDEKFLDPLPHHVHIDWRFLPPLWFKYFTRKWSSLLNHAMIMPKPKHIKFLTSQPKLLRCMRMMPPLPRYETATWYEELEQKYACAALVNGRCPHRGTPREAMVDVGDGVLVCPAHGLRWSTETGRLVRRGVARWSTI